MSLDKLYLYINDAFIFSSIILSIVLIITGWHNIDNAVNIWAIQRIDTNGDMDSLVDCNSYRCMTAVDIYHEGSNMIIIGFILSIANGILFYYLFHRDIIKQLRELEENELIKKIHWFKK